MKKRIKIKPVKLRKRENQLIITTQTLNQMI